MLESFKRWLRGDYNSVRYRFNYLPREWLEYLFLYRLRGKRWVDFYAARLDRAQAGKQDAPLQETYRQQGQMHLDFMKSHGLKPSHSLLDYGCGVCRSGIFFVRYLDSGRYTGVDISGERLERGRRLLEQEGLTDKDFQLVRTRDCRLPELKGRTFDVVFANSVLTHMPQNDIRTMLRAMRDLLAEGGRFYFTYAEADARKRRNIKDFWYSRDHMRALCEAAGYSFEILDDWKKQGDVMARISLRHSGS